jgi:hypothetical protein
MAGLRTEDPSQPRDVLTAREVISAGSKGYAIHELKVEPDMVGHVFFIEVSVREMQGRVDDIQVYVLDERAFRLWSVGRPAMPLVAAPRLIKATLAFRPEQKGRYYLLLDNRHSMLAKKLVEVSVVDVWAQGRERMPRLEGLAKLVGIDSEVMYEWLEEKKAGKSAGGEPVGQGPKG